MNSKKIKGLFTKDWEAKLTCLVISILLWYVMNDHIKSSTTSLKPEMSEDWLLRTPKK